ncbi:outer membrane protein transport protein [candidate division KSB1 bacterium]|nr:outer membrane protein transport protein [candidate division KSB1 bacterium]
MRKSLFVVALILSFSTLLMASGVSLTGVGARATALGGNFRGISNDWSAMFWNPAGLTQIKGLHAGLSFETIMPSSKYELKQNVPAFGVYKTTEFENEPKTFFIPAAGLVYGTEKWAFGLSFYVPFGLGAKWDAMDTKAFNDTYPEYDFEDDLKVIDIHPSIAFQATEKLSIGVGVGLVSSNIIIRKPTTTPNPLLFDAAYAQLNPLFTALGLTGGSFNHLLTETELEGDGMGFSASFGLQYKLAESFTVGVSGTWYNDIALDGKVSATTYYAKANAQTMTALGAQLTALGLPADQQQQILGVFSGAKQVKYDKAEADATLPLPMTVGAGFAYTGIENLLISGDVSWTQWSAWDVIDIEMKDGSKSELVENWEDGIRLGLGMEYKLSAPLTLRAGYYTEPSAIPDETLTITIPDISRRHGINIGATFNLGPIALHASYETLLIGDRTVDSWQYNNNAAAPGYDNMAGNYKMSVNNIMLGLGYNF